MKTADLTELLWRIVNEGDRLPLTEAEARLYTVIHLGLLSYEDEVRLGRPASERRCMICEVPLSECSC